MRKAEVYMNGVLAGCLEEIETKKGIFYASTFPYDESYIGIKRMDDYLRPLP